MSMRTLRCAGNAVQPKAWIIRSLCPRLLCPLAVLLLLLLTGGSERTRAQSTDEEYRVKAAFIFHFAQLVEWPPETSPENSLFLCTIGDDPFQGALENTVAGKAIGERLIQILHLKQGDDLQACQVLFVSREQKTQAPMLLAALHNAPVLTVGEAPGFLEAGGMISFVLDQNNVRFEINLDAAESAKLKIGSRLLLLAQTVVREGREK